MVEPVLHGPVEVRLLLLHCSDFLIDSGGGGAFAADSERGAGFRQLIHPAYGRCSVVLSVSLFRSIPTFFFHP